MAAPAPHRAVPCHAHSIPRRVARQEGRGAEPSRAEPCRCALRAHRSRPRSASQLPGTCCCRRPSRHAERPADPRAAAGRAVMGGRHRERHRQWERAAARARARRGQRPAGGSGSAERRCSAGLRPSGRPRRCADAVLGRGAEPAGDLQTRGAGGGQGGRRGRRLLRVLHQPHLRLRRWQRPQVRLRGRGCAAGGKGKGRERKKGQGRTGAATSGPPVHRRTSCHPAAQSFCGKFGPRASRRVAERCVAERRSGREARGARGAHAGEARTLPSVARPNPGSALGGLCAEVTVPGAGEGLRAELLRGVAADDAIFACPAPIEQGMRCCRRTPAFPDSSVIVPLTAFLGCRAHQILTEQMKWVRQFVVGRYRLGFVPRVGQLQCFFMPASRRDLGTLSFIPKRLDRKIKSGVADELYRLQSAAAGRVTCSH